MTDSQRLYPHQTESPTLLQNNILRLSQLRSHYVPSCRRRVTGYLCDFLADLQLDYTAIRADDTPPPTSTYAAALRTALMDSLRHELTAVQEGQRHRYFPLWQRC